MPVLCRGSSRCFTDEGRNTFPKPNPVITQKELRGVQFTYTAKSNARSVDIKDGLVFNRLLTDTELGCVIYCVGKNHAGE